MRSLFLIAVYQIVKAVIAALNITAENECPLGKDYILFGIVAVFVYALKSKGVSADDIS